MSYIIAIFNELINCGANPIENIKNYIGRDNFILSINEIIFNYLSIGKYNDVYSERNCNNTYYEFSLNIDFNRLTKIILLILHNSYENSDTNTNTNSNENLNANTNA